ncbi:cache domain-containing sensor histidine kinase [Paenibacillus xerothermodurans]|uniref:histidine kinase n=1 Tax=Paenibacillus xerothermodurans TaxID=1977292 RepID=A0A2W1NAX4_PAEXE|nr:sensor histidine kinase [Paenibacillus xerothermodurans]PZE21074.1 sensor histidine kinase [Paenibacillus xerothermodurans]
MKKKRHFAFKDKLFNKMFLLMSVSVFLPVALLGFLSYDKSKSQLTSVTSQLLEDNLQLNAKQLNTFFKSVEKETEKMIASKPLQSLLRSPPPKSYEEEVSFINGMVDVIISLKGSYELYVLPKNMEHYPHYRKLLTLNKLQPGSNLFERAYMLQRTGIWLHVWDDNLHKATFIYVRAIRANNLEPLGILAVQIPDYIFLEELESPSSFERYLFLMVDSENHIISHPSSGFYNTEYIPRPGWFQAEKELDEGGWKLIAAVPQQDIAGSIEQIKNFSLWIVVGSLAVISLLLYLIVRSVTRPLSAMVAHMDEVGQGNLSPFRFNRSRADEVGQLAQGYNQMIAGMTELLHTTRQMEADKRQLELQTLNHQINPHFFYNTLDAIKWRAETVRESTIATMVTKLANLLRFSLNNGDEWTTIEREIEHAKNYLDIELLRSNRSFQLFIQADPDLMKQKIIKLILQPIVENAVKHGMSKLPEGKGKIRLTVKRSDGDIVFIVEDNGPGLQDKHTPHLDVPGGSDAPRGIGLSNVHKRMQLHFGANYGIHIDRNQSPGLRVVVRHPM